MKSKSVNLKRTQGQSLIEFGSIVVLVALAGAASVEMLGGNISEQLGTYAKSFQGGSDTVALVAPLPSPYTPGVYSQAPAEPSATASGGVTGGSSGTTLVPETPTASTPTGATQASNPPGTSTPVTSSPNTQQAPSAPNGTINTAMPSASLPSPVTTANSKESQAGATSAGFCNQCYMGYSGDWGW